jgi:acetyltransferase-like isoleucine patch superfamily enzyme
MNNDKSKIYPNVHLGEGVTLEDWVVIGLPPKGAELGQIATIIEDAAYIRSHSVIYAGSRIGQNFQTGHRTILGPGLEIGANCSVGTDSVVLGYAKFFNRVKVHGYCYIGAFCVIEEEAWVGPHCVVDSQPDQPTLIMSRAILGSELYVPPGLRIGERSLVAAGVSLKQNVPPYRLIAGNPPRALRQITRLTCPYELIDHPYQADPKEIEESILARQQEQEDQIFLSRDNWRYKLWESLGCPDFFL